MKRILVCVAISLFSLTASAEREVLHRGNSAEPATLDPHRARGDIAGNIIRDLYEGLLREGPDASLQPGVATHWTVSEDGLEYVFRLRENARWSNGDPVTAHDFVFALQRSVDPATASPNANSLRPIANATEILAGELPAAALGVHAVADYKLRIRLVTPTAYFLSLLVRPNTYPVHAATLKEQGVNHFRPGNLISNGAYRLADWVVHSHIELRRNENYWHSETVRIPVVRYYPIEDENAELNRFRSGELDVTYTIPPGRHEWLSENLPTNLKIAPYLATYYLIFNLTASPFKNNFKLRRALSMVTDLETITRKITANGEVAAYGMVPPGIPRYQSQQVEYADWPLTRRIAEARRLYREAGYSRRRPLRVELRFNSGELHRRIALAVSSMWREQLGVETTLIGEEWKVFLENRFNRDLVQVFRGGWAGDYNDSYTFLQLFESSSPLNEPGYENEQYDKLLAEAATAVDPERRRVLLQEAEKLLMSEQPVLPLYFVVSKHLVNETLKGWEDNVMDHHLSQYLYFDSN